MAYELVRYLYEQRQLPEESGFYQEALKEIEKDGISSQIYYFLEKQGMLTQTPHFFQQCLKKSGTKVFYQNLFIKHQTNQLLAKFSEQEIEVIPLKGIYFAEKYFGHFAARPTSDIDLLIKAKDIEKASACVKELGFTNEEEAIPGHFHSSFSKKLPNSRIPLVVEIHWDIVKQDLAKLDINEFWQNALPANKSGYIQELSPYHSFYMIVLHGWRHNLDSLKYFIDIIEMIQSLKAEIDYERLLSDARIHQTYKRIVRTLTIVYQQFPHLESIKKFPASTKVYWKYRTSRNLTKYIDFIDYQFFSYDSLKHSSIEFYHWIFPPNPTIICQLDENGQHKSTLKNYLSLVKKRVASFLKAFFPVKPNH